MHRLIFTHRQQTWVGGGYALSEATKVSHLDTWMSNQLVGLNTLPPFVIMILACLIISIVTEVSSNTATAAIFLPVLAKLVS
jgi:sodium-dependent dicarboxylate transporter 2/3/5